MKNDYIFENKEYESAVKSLKATFFDIVFQEEAMLKNLEERIQKEYDSNVKNQMIELLNKQNKSLDETLELIDKLTNSVVLLDSFVQELNSIDDKIVEGILNKSDKKEEVEELEVIGGPNDTSINTPVESPPEELISEAPAEELPQEEVPINIDPNTDDSVFEPIEEVPEETEEPIGEEQNEEVVEDVPTEEVVEQPEEPITEETVEEQIPEEENTDVVEEQTEPQVEENTEIDLPDVVETDTIEENSDGSQTFRLKVNKRNSEDKAKAIIVNQLQYSKLESSISTQDALLHARGIFRDNDSIEDANKEEPMVNVITIDSANTLNDTETSPKVEIDEDFEIPELVEVTPQNIESMMQEANDLYKEGKVDEAKEMYDEISLMNKNLQTDNDTAI